ncbi:hypothetical protein EGR_01985 [Echinococcus granulosus]|uniref:Uncharacterized protein n=1 Tax=Echinococcus granulosus TaxID=6210 RepID=W6UR83_ECHGR|nr:hypothetical protein EGR_01985 [Echinococcus granulosus]EUB63181.1 hypothetical protein EGR_01985 [Echinococcus granulosus]
MADSQSAFKFKKANIPGNQRICHVLSQSKLFMDGRIELRWTNLRMPKIIFWINGNKMANLVVLLMKAKISHTKPSSKSKCKRCFYMLSFKLCDFGKSKQSDIFISFLSRKGIFSTKQLYTDLHLRIAVNEHCYPAAKITITQISLYPRGELWYLLKSGFTSPSWFRFKAYFIVKKEVSHILHCKNSLKYPRLRFKDKINGHLLQCQQLVILDSTVMTSQYTLLIFMTYTFSYAGYSDLIGQSLNHDVLIQLVTLNRRCSPVRDFNLLYLAYSYFYIFAYEALVYEDILVQIEDKLLDKKDFEVENCPGSRSIKDT